MVELPSWRGPADSPQRVIDLIDRWAASGAMRSLVAAFGGRLPPTEQLGWLDAFSAEHWDFRGGRERNLAARAPITAEQAALVMDLAPEFGLSGQETPSGVEYDTVIMTGGMVRAGIVKPRHVAALLENGIRVRSVVFLGGFRPFGGDEAELAARLGIRGDDEVAAMLGGMDFAFGPLGRPAVTNGDGWSEYRWQVGDLALSVVAAPSSDPSRRANSSDTFRFWAAERHEGAQRVLVVTTPIYVPYQAASAVETLGLEGGFAVETVSTSAAASDLGEYTQVFEPAHHLQELRSAVRGIRSLRARLSALTAS